MHINVRAWLSQRLWHDIFECNISQAIIKRQITFYPTMIWIETHKPWARLVIHQSLTTTVVKIVRLSQSTLSPDELTCSVRSKRRHQNQIDNRDINDKLNPLYTLFTMINIFHDIYLLFSFLIFDYIFFHSVQFRIFTCSHHFVTLKSETFKD